MLIANLYFLGPTDLRPALNALDRPALFVYSSLDWSVAAAQEVRKGWSAMPVKVIDTQSHVLFVAKPQEFNRVLESFWLHCRSKAWGAFKCRGRISPTRRCT